jgi:predicted nucleotidyltransferase
VTDSQLDAERIFATLEEHGVEYVLIGALAVAAHGYVRATRDVDIVPAPTPANYERLAAALGSIDAKLIGGELLPEVSLDAESLASGANFPVETAHGRLDVMQDEPGIPDYEALARDAFRVELGEHTVKVCSRDDLLAMKRAAGRDRDLLDVKELEAL